MPGECTYRNRCQALRLAQPGFTLVELIVAMTTVAVLLAIAVPTYVRVRAQNHLATSVNLLVMAMLSARQTAVSLNTPVTFCAGNPLNGCDGDWSARRWIVFIDVDRDGRVDAEDELRLVEDIGGGDVIDVSANGPFNGSVVFNPAGLAQRPSGAFAAGRIRVCAKKAFAPNATDLVLIGSGRLVTEPHDFAGTCPAAG